METTCSKGYPQNNKAYHQERYLKAKAAKNEPDPLADTIEQFYAYQTSKLGYRKYEFSFNREVIKCTPVFTYNIEVKLQYSNGVSKGYENLTPVEALKFIEERTKRINELKVVA